MNTDLQYLYDAYKRSCEATVMSVATQGKTTVITLDTTVFYPQGGGQPADTGTITGKNGELAVSHVSYGGGEPKHLGTLKGTIKRGEKVTAIIDWERRYTNMQLHTAGHILDQAVKLVIPKANAVDGMHGIGKAMHIAYTNQIPQEKVAEIQTAIDQLIQQDYPISLEMVTAQEIRKRKIHVPFDLPKDKPLRIMGIGVYPAMPDGGTQLKSTSESWPIVVTGVKKKGAQWLVQYLVQPPTSQKKQAAKTAHTDGKPGNFVSAADSMLANAMTDHKTMETEAFRIKYLGKKGALAELMAQLKSLATEEKRQAGLKANEVKQALEKLTQSVQQSAADQWIDLTIPGLKPKVGHVHPVSQAMDEITRIFQKIGFMRVRYPEVDWEWYPFDSLNMPKNHPARDEWETFLVQNEFVHPKLGKMVLTPHTSNGQVREMERLHSTPPIRMINIARCYRRQADVTHTEMFHQFEGLVVDKGITIQHLKGTIDHFAREFYGPNAKSRIRPFHFQFTEPSFEVDFSCTICNGTGTLGKEKCRFCKSGWHEVGGAGMVHPNVLKSGNIDPEVYTGFAFGWGIERTYTLREGLKLDDIRLLYSGDMRFLEQF